LKLTGFDFAIHSGKSLELNAKLLGKLGKFLGSKRKKRKDLMP
jgi:hypothetical protein